MQICDSGLKHIGVLSNCILEIGCAIQIAKTVFKLSNVLLKPFNKMETTLPQHRVIYSDFFTQRFHTADTPVCAQRFVSSHKHYY